MTFFKKMTLMVFAVTTMFAVSCGSEDDDNGNVPTPVGINADSPDGTRGFHGGRECVVVTLKGKKYAVATKNLGAEKETDYGNYYVFDELRNPSNIGVSVVSTEWHVPTHAELESFAALANEWATLDDINGRKWNIGSTYIFLPAAGNYGYLQGDNGCYWSSTEKDADKAYYMLFSNNNCSITIDNQTTSLTIRPFCALAK